ncbi:hypothetical protein NDU88_004013 [Pleurodeles waltl]|uniref:Uncharacterized protein n=1 Tax=Pleurodeles waltl TaxID=8319 RepID=A0AAV7KY60_PLEWA|nr:hypothetical protein NDU88_004013 [Pleurodeles waltl]
MLGLHSSGPPENSHQLTTRASVVQERALRQDCKVDAPSPPEAKQKMPCPSGSSGTSQSEATVGNQEKSKRDATATARRSVGSRLVVTPVFNQAPRRQC